MQTELVKICPVCKGSDFTNILNCKDYTYSQEYFHIQKCRTCQLLLTNPRPNQESIEKYYQSPDYISHAAKSNSLFDHLYFLARKIALSNKLNLITQYQKQGMILDYGCGTGEFLAFMNSRNWRGLGVEPSETARSRANKLLGNNSSSVYTSLGELPSTKFNVITLWHVLEHVPEPAALLTTLKSLLDKNGFIFVAVPNHESYDAQYYQEYWAGYDVPRHFWHFSQLPLQRLLENNSLQLIGKVPMKLDAYYVSLLSEKYKNDGSHNLISPFKAFIQGMRSNAKAKKSMNYSSLIYIARHG